MKQRATFKEMNQSTEEDWMHVGVAALHARVGLADRVLDHLRLLDNDYGGFPVDRLEHCLQTATRAEADGRDEEYVVCALLHDIGDTLGSYNHAELAAKILQPFISEENYWMVKHHGIFQGYYFFHQFGLDRNQRDQFKDSPYYAYTAEFCSKYDQNSFDTEYESKPLEHFIPMLRRFFETPKKSIYKDAKPKAR
jgi:predicted HD phosphohydrolase